MDKLLFIMPKDGIFNSNWVILNSLSKLTNTKMSFHDFRQNDMIEWWARCPTSSSIVTIN